MKKLNDKILKLKDDCNENEVNLSDLVCEWGNYRESKIDSYGDVLVNNCGR